MGWIRIAGKGLEYAGKLAQADGFEEWAADQGRAVVEALAEKQAFSFFGRRRKARKLLLRQLQDAGRSEALAAAIGYEAEAYPKLLGDIAEIIQSNEFIAEWRTFVVPRFLFNAVALRKIEERLSGAAELERLQGGPSLQSYFFNKLVKDLDTAFTGLRSSVKNPVATAHGWWIIKYDGDYDWKSPPWPGHFYVVQTRDKSIDKERRARLEKQVRDLQVVLGRFSVAEIARLVNAWNDWLTGKVTTIEELAAGDE